MHSRPYVSVCMQAYMHTCIHMYTFALIIAYALYINNRLHPGFLNIGSGPSSWAEHREIKLLTQGHTAGTGQN